MTAPEQIRRIVAIAGRVTIEATGKPAAGALVEIAGGPSTRAAPDGVFYFLDLPNGSYDVTARLPGTGARYLPATTTITVARDAQGRIPLGNHVLALAATVLTGRVRGSGATPVALAAVSLDGSGERTLTAADGTFRLVAVEPGPRSLRTAGNGFQLDVRTFTVAPGVATDVTVTLTPK